MLPGEHGPSIDLFAEVVGVRVNGQHIHGDRKVQVVGHYELRRAWRNIQRSVVLQLQQHRKSLGGPVREIESNCHVHSFWFSGGLQM